MFISIASLACFILIAHSAAAADEGIHLLQKKSAIRRVGRETTLCSAPRLLAFTEAPFERITASGHKNIIFPRVLPGRGSAGPVDMGVATLGEGNDLLFGSLGVKDDPASVDNGRAAFIAGLTSSNGTGYGLLTLRARIATNITFGFFDTSTRAPRPMERFNFSLVDVNNSNNTVTISFWPPCEQTFNTMLDRSLFFEAEHTREHGHNGPLRSTTCLVAAGTLNFTVAIGKSTLKNRNFLFTGATPVKRQCVSPSEATSMIDA